MITKSYDILAIAEHSFADYVSSEQALTMKLQSLDINACRDEDEDEGSYIYQMVDDVAVIEVKGGLTSRDSWYNRYFGMVSYNEIIKASAQAIEENAKATVYDWRTPGGSVQGMNEAAEFISNMPMETISYGTMLSAGYFLGVQADQVYTSEFDDVGSVGVVLKIYDRSKMLAERGIKPERFRSGELKAVGDGDFKLTDKERKYITTMVNAIAGKFYGIVADARGTTVEILKKLGITDGGTYMGEDALAVNLVDGVITFEESMQKAFDLAKKVDKQDQYGLIR